MHAEYMEAVSSAMSTDSVTRNRGLEALQSHVRRAWDNACTPADQCVFFTAVKHVQEPAAFALLHVILKVTDDLDADQAAALQTRNQELLSYALCDDRKLQAYFWRMCDVLWKHNVATMHPATACHLWRSYLTNAAPLHAPDAAKEHLLTVFRLLRALPVNQDAASIHAFLLETYAAYADVIVAHSALLQRVVTTINVILCNGDAAVQVLPTEWVTLLLRQLEEPATQDVAVAVLEDLTHVRSNHFCAPLIAAGACEHLLRLIQTRTGAALCTCAVRTLQNLATRHFSAWSILVLPAAMAVYAVILQRDTPECVKSCVRQLVTALCIFPECVRAFMQGAGLESVLQQDVSAGRFRSSTTADMFTDLLSIAAD